MKKPLIKNYTTEIPTEKTIAEIQKLLAENGATGIALDYDGQGNLVAIFFRIETQGKQLSFRLPAKPNEVYQTLYKGRQQEYAFKKKWEQDAVRIAWQICKLWLEAQLTHVNLGQAQIQEVFLPYLLVGEKKTLFEDMEQRQFLLPSP